MDPAPGSPNSSTTQLGAYEGICARPAALRGLAGPPKAPPASRITDGTSNTFLFGEVVRRASSSSTLLARPRPLSQPCNSAGNCPFEGQGWWADADFGDSSMSTFYPINIKGADSCILPSGCEPAGNINATTATSNHPGGANFAFADGSVKFIKDSINTWNYQLIGRDANCLPVLPAGMNGAFIRLSPPAMAAK